MRETFKSTLIVGLLALFAPKLWAQDGQPAPPDEAVLELGFSATGGFYNGPLVLTLTAPGAAIFYTTDGSRPTEKSARYREPLLLEKTVVIRAFAKMDGEKSRTATETFFIDEPRTSLPVVSIAITPSILFDETTGLFQDGPNVDRSEEGKFGANFWSRKEVTCNAEVFESDGRAVHNSLAGFRLFGGFSRAFPQKSMVLAFRKEYGKKFFKHRIFGDEAGKKFKYLVLRNGGSDWGKGQMRDALMGQLTDGWGLEKQAYRPSHVYINGKYWGLYDLREKINARFLADHSDADKDSLDLIEHRQTVRRGSIRHYAKMLRYMDDHDLGDPIHFKEVARWMDVDNFMDHQIAEIYCNNTDAGGNIRFWRPHRPGGKWRWILFDTDFGFGLNDHDGWNHDALEFFTEPNGPEWPNPPWSTFLLRNLLKNKSFEADFVNRFCDRLNTSLSATEVLSTISLFEQNLAPELPRQWDRWKLDPADWQRHLGIMRRFAEKRPEAMLGFMQKKWPHLGRPTEVNIEITPGGHVVLNNCIEAAAPFFHGEYFEKLPIRVKAVAAYGHRFAGWAGVEKRKELTIIPGKLAGRTLRAVFEKYDHPLANQLFFNELAANDRNSGDWIEIVNSSKEPVQLRGWVISDGTHEFTFPEKTVQPGGFVVVCEDLALFQKAHPSVAGAVGGLGFGLDKIEEDLLLFAADGGSIDSASYRVAPLDEACSIDLLLPKLDNGNPENWRQRSGTGSPGEPNPFYLATVAAEKKELFVRIGMAAAVLLIGFAALGWRRRAARAR